MDYKKKYEEALERAKDLHDNHALGKPFIYKTCEDIFHELKESEDEQSKEWILEYLWDGLQKSDEQFKGQFKAAINWLEKQGEHKCDCKYVGCHVNNVKRWCRKKQSEIPYEKCNIKCSEYLKKDEQTYSEFEHNGHMWGMCAKDNGVGIILDGKLIQHISIEKQNKRKSLLVKLVGNNNV